MSAIHILFDQLRARLPADEAESIIDSYRENAAADSRASRQRAKERHQRQQAFREQRQQAWRERHRTMQEEATDG